MPRQSQGAAGVDASQPANAPRGSWRLCLKESNASISESRPALVKVAVRMAQSATARRVLLAVDIINMVTRWQRD